MGNSSSRDQPPGTHHGPATIDNPRLHPVDYNSSSGARRQQRDRSEDPHLQTSTGPPSDRLFLGHGLRQGRHEIGFFGIGSGSERENTEVRRETRGEKDARRAERDRRMRIKERARSMHTEDADGGYLVTMGVYTVMEDFSKPIVRQMMIERRLAPFWKGLEDINSSWTDTELITAVRGESISLQVPINPYSTAGLPSPSSPSLQSPQGPPGDSNFLTIPDTVFRSRSKSCESNQPSSNRSSSPDLASLDPSSQNNRGLSVRPRSKTQAVAMNLSESQSAANLLALETKLPQAGNLGGKCLERVLYETSADCSICFLSYPKWLNKTRCCDQPICSECFVQIKRPDPHVPEHHGDANSGRPPSPQLASDLVSEAACCPFCKVPEFGISYDAPPFRRGLAYANSEISKMAAARAEELSAAMILETAEISASPPQQTETRRRMKSLSVDDPSVITTDMIRPDWAQKLSNARAQLHRRAAAATALHTAAYMMGNDGRSPFGFGFGRRGLLRHGFGEGTGPNGAEEADPGSRSAFEEYVRSRMEDANHPRAGAGAGAGPSSMPEAGNPFFGFGARPSQHQPRIVDIEDMMMMEAIRQSLIEDEERKKRDENVARKRGRFRGNSATGGDRGGA